MGISSLSNSPATLGVVRHAREDDGPGPAMREEQRTTHLGLIFYSGTLDRLYPGAVLAAEAVQRGVQVDILLTFWAVLAARREPGAFRRLVSRDYGVQGAALAELLRTSDEPPWITVLRRVKDKERLRVRACAFSLDLLGLVLGDLDPLVEEAVGIGEFIEAAGDGQLVFF